MIWAHTLRHPSCHLDHPTHRGHQVHLWPGRVGQKHPDPDGRPHLLLGTDHLSPGASRKNSLVFKPTNPWNANYRRETLPECDISVSKLLGFETFPIILMVSVSVSKFFGIEKSIGIGFENFWYRKKYRYRFRKFLVSKKVSVSVSENFGIEKSIGFGIEKFWYRKKVSVSVSFRFLVSSLTGTRDVVFAQRDGLCSGALPHAQLWSGNVV